MTGLRPYRRRRMLPVVVVVSVLAVVAVTTWATVLVRAGNRADVIACPAPASGTVGSVLETGSLDAVAPVGPGAVQTAVLNAGGRRGQANLVAAQLADLGFGQARRPDNDKVYPDGTLACHGQLRFGRAGEPAAATLALVMPCLELVRDERGDPSVDVAVGTEFADIAPTRTVRDVLEQLGAPAGETGEGQQVAAPQVDPAVLEGIRDQARC